MNTALAVLLGLAAVAIAARLLWTSRAVTTVYAPNIGLLYRDGRFVRELAPGRYARFDPLRRTRIVVVPTSELPNVRVEATVLTQDQFSLRIALSPVIAVADARTFHESQPAYDSVATGYVPTLTSHAAVSTLLTAAATEVVSGRTLAALLADQQGVAAEVAVRVAGAVPGATIIAVLLTGISLPPETRKMFTEVERARFEAQAAVERARGEQAALRTLANAARLIADNPALANLRLLQALEKGKGNTTVVLGAAGAPMPGLGGGPDRSA